MEELKKMNRIIDREFPDAHRENLVVLDGTTGQNALVQAREFSQVADLTGIILTKMDGTAKGGIAVAIQSELHIPVKYIGVGETIDDLQKFDADQFVNALFDIKTTEEGGMTDMEEEKMLTLETFEEAAEVVKKVTLETKLVYSDYFSQQTGAKVYIKPENMQFTGAYKVRGAYYKMSTLSEEERQKGVITASAGNHAQGVAYAAQCYGVKSTIVMPTTTPLIKVNRTKGYGADVVLYGDVYDEACAKAYELAEEHGYTFVHPFDDLAVATGQGTIAMEIIKELPLVDYILVPIGGGGPRGRSFHSGETAQSQNPGHRRGTGQCELYAGVPEKWQSDHPADSQYHRRRDGGENAGGKDFPLYSGKPGRYHHRGGCGAGGSVSGYGGEPQDDRGELRPFDGGGIETSGREGQESGRYLKRGKYGRDHHVLRRAAGTDPARQDLYGIRAVARQAGRAA